MRRRNRRRDAEVAESWEPPMHANSIAEKIARIEGNGKSTCGGANGPRQELLGVGGLVLLRFLRRRNKLWRRNGKDLHQRGCGWLGRPLRGLVFTPRCRVDVHRNSSRNDHRRV